MTDTATNWPYDARQDDPLTKLRIPVVHSSHPEWNYITAFDASNGQRPTDAEKDAIEALDFYQWANQMRGTDA